MGKLILGYANRQAGSLCRSGVQVRVHLALTLLQCRTIVAASPATNVTGCGAAEVSEAMGISEGNQRVLLHRARARVRAQLERHFDA